MSIVQIVALLKTLGPYAVTIIRFAIEHKAEFQALLAALRELFSGGGAFAAAPDVNATTPDMIAITANVAAECGCSESEAVAFIDACG